MSTEPQPLIPGKGAAICIFGLPDAGKTRLLASAGSVLIIHPPTEHTDSITPREGVEEIVAEHWDEMYDIKRWGQQGGYKKYDFVGLDTISSMQDFLLDDVLADAVARKPTRGTRKGGVEIPELGPDKGEYNVNIIRLRQWVGDHVGFAKSGMFNFVVTAHPAEWYNPVTQEELWAPWVQGKNMIPKICGMMNIIAYMSATHKKGKKRQETLIVDADGFVGKDQFKCFPELKSGRHGFINPTMADIEAAIDSKRPRKKTTGRRKPKRRRRNRTKE